MQIKKMVSKSQRLSGLLVEYLGERLRLFPSICSVALYPTNVVKDIGILFRPYLFCVGLGCNPRIVESDFYDIAVAIELLQVSTLIIDDIFDESPLRNGMQSMPERFGIKDTIIIGELFKSLSNEIILGNRLITATKKKKLLSLFEYAYQMICIGQFDDLLYEKLPTISEEKYFDMIANTTGYFIQKSLLAGALIAGVNSKQYNALSEYGLKLGIAYQLRDDMINLLTDGSNGKQIAEDLIAKKKRLPMIYLLNNCEIGSDFRKIWDKSKLSNEDISSILDIICNTKTLDYCIHRLQTLCNEAKKSISRFKFGKQTEELIELADLVGNLSIQDDV